MARKKPAPAPQPADPATEPLTPEQERFVGEYIIDDNGTRAYKAAFPAAAYTTCRTEASLLLAKPNIRTAVRAMRDARQKRTGIRADSALREAARLAYSDPLYLFEDDGLTPRNIRDVPMDTRRAIASVKVQEERTERRGEVTVRYRTVEYKLWPKPKGLDKVFRHLGLEQEVSPLDALLAALPAALREQVRAALTGGTGG